MYSDHVRILGAHILLIFMCTHKSTELNFIYTIECVLLYSSTRNRRKHKFFKMMLYSSYIFELIYMISCTIHIYMPTIIMQWTNSHISSFSLRYEFFGNPLICFEKVCFSKKEDPSLCKCMYTLHCNIFFHFFLQCYSEILVSVFRD